jgi:hypothetical protein
MKFPKKQYRRRIPSSRTNLTSTEESSGTDRDQPPSEEVNSGSGSASGQSSSRVLDDSLSSSEALTERDEEENETAGTNNVRCSSEEVSRILASAAEADENEKDDDEDVAEWRQVVTDMTECIDFFSSSPFSYIQHENINEIERRH